MFVNKREISIRQYSDSISEIMTKNVDEEECYNYKGNDDEVKEESTKSGSENEVKTTDFAVKSIVKIDEHAT